MPREWWNDLKTGHIPQNIPWRRLQQKPETGMRKRMDDGSSKVEFLAYGTVCPSRPSLIVVLVLVLLQTHANCTSCTYPKLQKANTTHDSFLEELRNGPHQTIKQDVFIIGLPYYQALVRLYCFMEC
jgi:hypothetical protein